MSKVRWFQDKKLTSEDITSDHIREHRMGIVNIPLPVWLIDELQRFTQILLKWVKIELNSELWNSFWVFPMLGGHFKPFANSTFFVFWIPGFFEGFRNLFFYQAMVKPGFRHLFAPARWISKQ